MKKQRGWWICGAGLFACFAALVLLLLTVDVGKDAFGEQLGLYSLNVWFWKLVGTNTLAARVSEILGAVMLVFPCAFALLGAWRLIKTRSLRGVGGGLYLLAGLYVVMALFYGLFELFPLNMRPFVEGMTETEASFPSSHTLMAMVLGLSVPGALRSAPMTMNLKRSISVSAVTFTVLTVLSRALSGRHWLSDILGGILLGAALVAFYYALLSQTEKTKEKEHA